MRIVVTGGAGFIGSAVCRYLIQGTNADVVSVESLIGSLVAVAWHRTYGLPVIVSNCSNNYGPYHFPEKLIPLLPSWRTSLRACLDRLPF